MKVNRLEDIVSDKPNPCSECPSYSTCDSLCDKVDRWAGQDHVGSSSRVLLENGDRSGRTVSEKGGDFSDWAGLNVDTYIDLDPSREAWLKIKNMRLSEKVMRFIYSYYFLGKRIRDIAIDEKATSQAIDRRHHHSKMCVRDRLLGVDLWRIVDRNITYKSIAQYDAAIFFYKYSYPRRVIAKALSVNASTILKYISKKNRELETSAVS